MDDREIVDLFLARSEKAINELASKYGGLCHKISYNILNNAFDAEESVTAIMMWHWKKLKTACPMEIR